MPFSFSVSFEDGQTLVISDIIQFEEEQVGYIKNIASKTTQQFLMDQRYGEDIYITDGQKRVVISEKNSIVELGTSEYLLDNKLVRIGKHSLKRILQRVGSDSFETLITIIDRIKIMNHVHKAQWKGYPQLSYTLKLENDPNRFKISISFEPSEIENHTLKVITVSNVRSSDFSSIPKENMEQRINENPILVEKMEKIKERLKKL